MLRIVRCCIATRFLITSWSWIGKRVLIVHRFGPRTVAQSFAKLGTPHRCSKNVYILQDGRTLGLLNSYLMHAARNNISLELTSPSLSLSLSLSPLQQDNSHKLQPTKHIYKQKISLCMTRCWNLYQLQLNVYTLSVAKEKLFPHS